jgi:hypothetical protein
VDTSKKPDVGAEVRPPGRRWARQVRLRVDGAAGAWCRAVDEHSRRSGRNRPCLEPGEAVHVGDQVGEPELGRARAMPTERMAGRRRHLWAAKTCSIATRTCALLALPRVMCGGMARGRIASAGPAV